jgi:hypothetical protein
MIMTVSADLSQRPADEFSYPRHPLMKIIFWSSTALFIGFSLGVVACHIAAMQQPKCIEGKSEIAPGPFAS